MVRSLTYHGPLPMTSSITKFFDGYFTFVSRIDLWLSWWHRRVPVSHQLLFPQSELMPYHVDLASCHKSFGWECPRFLSSLPSSSRPSSSHFRSRRTTQTIKDAMAKRMGEAHSTWSLRNVACLVCLQFSPSQGVHFCVGQHGSLTFAPTLPG